MNGEGGIGGLLRQPAQRETISGGYEGGVRIPIFQAFASIIFASMGILFFWLLLFVIGPDVLWVAGFIVIAIVARYLFAWIGSAQCETRKEINGVRAMTISASLFLIFLSGAWAASRQFCVDNWPVLLPQVSIWRTLFAITFIVPPIIVCFLMAFQFAVNAYNPAAFQPHQAKPPGTPWWSPTGQYVTPTEQNEDDDKAEIMAALAEAIAANQAKPLQYVDRITPVIASTSQPVGAVVSFDPNRLVRTNGEVPVRLADVERFCAALDARGATYEAWSEWHYDKWHSVVCFCAQLGITTEPKPRSRTRAQKTSADALAMLHSMYPKTESNPPTLPKTDDESVILSGRGIDRTEQNTEGG